MTVVVAGVLLSLWLTRSLLSEAMWLLVASVGLATVGVVFHLELRRIRRHDSSVHSLLERLIQSSDRELGEFDVGLNWSGGEAWRQLFAKLQTWLLAARERLEEAEHARSRAEVRLSRQADEQGQIRQVFDGLSEPILVTNQYDELMLANSAAHRLFSLDDSETRQALSALADCTSLIELARETRRRKTASARVDEIELGEDDERCWYRASCRALTLGTPGELSQPGTVLVFSDISSEKEIQRRHAEFVAAASHELKTPLSGIRAYVELLRDGEAEDEETQEEFLEVIDSQSDRLQRLIENLLNLARIEAGVVDVDKQQQSLNELLEEAHSLVQPSSDLKEIHLVKDLSPMYLGVVADRDMVMQAAINLLSNAIKYTDVGGTVTLRSRLEDNSVVFEVEDTGVGLSDEDSGRVFDRFYRVKKDSQMAGGTGLGLPLAKHIVEDVHGGFLTLTSELGKGSTFRVVLPGIGLAKV